MTKTISTEIEKILVLHDPAEPEAVSDLMAALFRAFEIASTSVGMTVEILMERGRHVITEQMIMDFKFWKSAHKNVDFVNP